MTPAIHNPERKKRTPLTLDVEINFGQGAHRALTADMSESGVAIISDKAIYHEVGSCCRMKGEHKDKPFHIDCHVVRVYANKMALAFHNSLENQIALRAILDR